MSHRTCECYYSSNCDDATCLCVVMCACASETALLDLFLRLGASEGVTVLVRSKPFGR